MVIWGPFRLHSSHTKEPHELWNEVFWWHIVVLLWVLLWVGHRIVNARIIIISGRNNPMESKVYVPFCSAP